MHTPIDRRRDSRHEQHRDPWPAEDERALLLALAQVADWPRQERPRFRCFRSGVAGRFTIEHPDLPRGRIHTEMDVIVELAASGLVRVHFRNGLGFVQLTRRGYRKLGRDA